jgi:hypothetical protein
MGLFGEKHPCRTAGRRAVKRGVRRSLCIVDADEVMGSSCRVRPLRLLVCSAPELPRPRTVVEKLWERIEPYYQGACARREFVLHPSGLEATRRTG